MGIFSNVKKALDAYNPFILRRQNAVLKASAAERMMPFITPLPQSPDHQSRVDEVFNNIPANTDLLEYVSRRSDIITGIHRALRTELFRNGYELIRLENADSEDTIEDNGDIAADTEARVTQEYNATIEKLENVNENGQSILEVLEEAEDDINTFDNQAVMFRFSYEQGSKGDILGMKLKEVLRVHPSSIEKVMNVSEQLGFNDQGKELKCSLNNRTKVYTDTDTHPQTGEKLYRVGYKLLYNGSEMYLFPWEVCWDSRYRPSKRYGFSPIMTGWLKIRTLQYQDKYMMDLYEGKRPPKGLLAFYTGNMEALQKNLDTIKQRAIENPHMPGMLGVPPAATGGNGGKFVEFIDFMRSLDELQLTEVRDEFRRTLGFLYGVSPVLMNDASTGGGLNNEGLQYTVTNRVIEAAQNKYNTKLLAKLSKALGLKYHFLKLRESEEQDEMAKLQRQAQSLQNAAAAVRSGLKARYDERLGECVIASGDLVKEEPAPSPFFNPRQEPRPEPEPQRNTAEPSLPSPGNDNVAKADRSTYSSGSKLAQALKAELDKFMSKYQRKPTPQELEELVIRVRALTNDVFLPRMQDFYKTEYEKIARRMSGPGYQYTKLDENAINSLISQPVVTEAFSGLTDKLAKEVYELVLDAYTTPQGLSSTKLQNRLKDALAVSEFRAETIARTELSKVSAAARRISYKKSDPDDSGLYYWLGPDDYRTTETSKRIKARTKAGVKWPDMVRIIKEESAKDFPEWVVNDEYPVSHYNSRHTFILRSGAVGE